MKRRVIGVGGAAATAGLVAILFSSCTSHGPKVTADQVTQRMQEQVTAQQPAGQQLDLKCSASKVDGQGFGSYSCDLSDRNPVAGEKPTHFVVEVTPDGNGWQIKGDTGTTQPGD